MDCGADRIHKALVPVIGGEIDGKFGLGGHDVCNSISITSPSSESAVVGLFFAWSTEIAETVGMGTPISVKKALRSLVRKPPPSSMIAMVCPVPSRVVP